MAVNARNKRKLIYKEQMFYWYVRKNIEGIPRLHIISDDKKVNLDLPLFDTELSVAGEYVVRKLNEYYKDR